MKVQYKRWNIIYLLAFLVVLSACGGSGGGEDGEDGEENQEELSENANLTNLEVSTGTLVPAFNVDQLIYGVSVDATISEIAITATVEDSTIDSLMANDLELTSGITGDPIALVHGDNAIDVIVIAEDGETSRTYTLNVNRQPVVNNHSSQRVVFIADSETDDVFELFSVLDDGVAVPVKISGALVENGDVKSFQISPDRTLVAYLADQDTDRTVELYVVPIDGSEPAIRVSPPATSSVTSIKSVKWSHDSSALVFLGDIGTRGADELYMVENDGSNPRIINGSIGDSVEIGDYAWSPNSSFVAYEVYNRDKPWEVIGINSHQTGGTSTSDPGFSIRISDTLAPPRSIESFAWSDDSASVVYLADQDLLNQNELYVSTAGMTASDTKLSHDGASVSDYALSPDGSTVAYLSPFDSAHRLYTSSIDATVRGTQLSQTAFDVSQFSWSPESSTVAYLARPESLSDMTIDALFWSAADTSSIATILSSETAIADSGVKRFQWSPDSSSIAYLADHEVNNRFELYLSLLDGSSLASKRSAVLAEGGDVEAFAWSPDSEMLAFRAESDVEGVSALFTSLADGSRIATRVSQSNPQGSGDRGVFTFDWADDSEAITYHGNDRDGEVRELYTGLANGHIKGYLISGDNILPEYAYNASFMARKTYHDELTSLFRDGSWISEDRADLCGMAYHEESDAMFLSRCVGRSNDHTIWRYSFETSVLDEVYRYASQNDYGMRIVGDDLFILRTYDQSILHLSGLDRPTLTQVDEYLADVNLAGMEEKYDIAVFDLDFYLVAGNALGSAQHNGIHVLTEPDYDVLTELVSDVSADWPNEPFGYSRAIIHVNSGADNHLVVATGDEGNLERWTIDGVFVNEVEGFGSSYLQADANSRVYAVSTNTVNSSVTRWASDLSNQEIFNFDSTLNNGENLRFALRETASHVEIYMGGFRDSDLRIDSTAVTQ